MKKIIILVLLVCLTTMCSCKFGNKIETSKTDYAIILNSGSIFVYTFKDPQTNVWYIATPEGITPRVNADGTLYVSDNIK